MFREQYWSHVEKNQCTSFTKIKINVQHVSGTNISMKQVPGAKKHATNSMEKNNVQVPQKEKSTCNVFHEQK